MSCVLCLDVGNSNIFAGVFEDGKIRFRFRHETRCKYTPDQLGVFLRSVLREHDISIDAIKEIAICSVVPHVDFLLVEACKSYFGITPFMLKAGVKTGIQIKTAHPLEVGADLVATAIGACQQYPNQSLVVVDFGTVTTFTAVSGKKELLGAVFIPGLCMSMEALCTKTARLPPVNIEKPECKVGRTTQDSMQAGLYYGQLGALKEILKNMAQDVFNGKNPVVIGTGGLAGLFKDESVFTTLLPDLVLDGLHHALLLNQS